MTVTPVRGLTEADSRDEVRRGFVWLGSASLVARVLDIGKVAVVLWFLTHEELGEATLAWSVSVVLEALNGLGLGQALLQGGELSKRTLASAFWYTMAVATLLVFGVCAMADPIAQGFGRPSLAPMIMVASTKLWFVGAALVPLNQLNRALAFERIAVISTLATLTSGIVTCGIAIMGAGAWAPLIGHTASGLATMVLALWARPYLPSLQFDWKALRPHAAFGFKLSGANVLHQVYRNVDYLLVAQWLDVAAVGVYRVAFDLAMTPCLAVGQVVNRAAVPVYARLSHDRAALSRMFLWTLRSLGLALTPVCLLIALSATPLLSVVKGGTWSEAAPVVPWLCAAAFLRCLDQTFPQLFQALHRPWLSLYDSILACVLVSAAIGVMLQIGGKSYGAVAAGFGWVLAYPLLIAFLIGVTRRLLPLTPGQVMRTQLHAFGGALAMFLTYTLASALSASAGAQLRLAINLLVSLLAYAAYLHGVVGIRLTDAFSIKRSARSHLAVGVAAQA